MGIGPVFAILKLLTLGLKMDDIALGAQRSCRLAVLYCQQKAGIPDEILNVKGGSISIVTP